MAEVVVAGHLMVEPENRDDYLSTCVEVVRQARASAGLRTRVSSVLRVRSMRDLASSRESGLGIGRIMIDQIRRDGHRPASEPAGDQETGAEGRTPSPR